MYIAPNSIIRCLSGVPIDNTYRNTLWWDSAAAQETYFYSKSKVSLGAQSYQRANRGFLKINVPVEQLYDCNYLMFQNTSFGNKWFYAFITNVEYVNNATSRVQYELDVMQTWFFDYTLGTNFVSREHIAIDTIGANLIPEGLETGEYIFEPTNYGITHTQWDLIIAATFDTTLIDAAPTLYNNTYTGLRYNTFPLNYVNPAIGGTVESNLAAINDFVTNLIAGNKIDGVVAVYAVPHKYTGIVQSGSTPTPSVAGTIVGVPLYTGLFGQSGAIKNNKLYTYPYSFVIVDNMAGRVEHYRYEDFTALDPLDTSTAHFAVLGNVSPNATELYTPMNHKGRAYNYTESMSTNIAVQSSFNVDAFKAFLAQSLTAHLLDYPAEIVNKPLQNVEFISSESPFGQLLDGIARGFGKEKSSLTGTKQLYDIKSVYDISDYDISKAAVGAALSGRDGVYRDLASLYSHRTKAAGNIGGNDVNILVGANQYGTHIYQMHIKPEFARCIDDYFSMFGYATNEVKTPNRSSRPHWNYVQLKNTHIEGGIPFDHESAICRIYDNGITFWKNPTEVGHYELDNRPV